MLFWMLTTSIFVTSLLMRMTRGHPLKDGALRIESLAIWNIRNRTIHIHHGYPGAIVLTIGLVINNNHWISIGSALIVSDIIFHVVSHLVWNDPWWD